MDPPETYGLPSEVKAMVPSRSVWPASIKAVAASLIIALGAFVSFGRRKARGPREGRARGPRLMNQDINPWVADPGWHDLIVWYFFLGGIAAGAYVMAALADLFGDAEDRRGVRVAYYIAFPLVSVCGLLLTIDLGRPERFWHMLIQSNTGWPMFKWWSPMSAGSWALTAFGAFSFASFVGVLAEDGWLGSEAILGPGLAAADRLDRAGSSPWADRSPRSSSARTRGSSWGRATSRSGRTPRGPGRSSWLRRPRPGSRRWSCSTTGCASASGRA